MKTRNLPELIIFVTDLAMHATKVSVAVVINPNSSETEKIVVVSYWLWNHEGAVHRVDIMFSVAENQNIPVGLMAVENNGSPMEISFSPTPQSPHEVALLKTCTELLDRIASSAYGIDIVTEEIRKALHSSPL